MEYQLCIEVQIIHFVSIIQAPCQIELEEWINSIHSACAAAFARHRGKTGTLHLLQEEIYRLEKGIESTQKLKHMAELQISVVSNEAHRGQILAQIRHWEDTLERMHCEQFRLRCYMASLQNGELPNPKVLVVIGFLLSRDGHACFNLSFRTKYSESGFSCS